MSKIIIIRASAIVLTCLAFWGNYHIIKSDRDFQRLTKEKLHLVNHQIELKDCSKNREELLTNVAVELYRKALAKTIDCIKENTNKTPAISYIYSEKVFKKLLSYQKNLAVIHPDFFMETKIQKEIDFFLQEYAIVFSLIDESYIDFKFQVFLSLFITEYSYWLLIYFVLIMIIFFVFFELEDEETEEYQM